MGMGATVSRSHFKIRVSADHNKTSRLGTDRVDIFYRVSNPSTWMYAFSRSGYEPSTICLHVKIILILKICN